MTNLLTRLLRRRVPDTRSALPQPRPARQLIFNEARPVAEFDKVMVDAYLEYLKDKHHGDEPSRDEDCF